MFRTSVTSLAALVVLLAPTPIWANTLRVYHRVVFPGQAVAAFTSRGTIEVSEDATSAPLAFKPADSAQGELQELRTWLAGASVDHLEAGLYQVALQFSDEQVDPESWDFQSVRLCHIPGSTTETISLQQAPGSSSGNHVYTFDYYVSPIPRDGSCPKPHSRTDVGHPLSNTTVALRSLNFPPITTLRAPIQLSEAGEPVKPPVEQSFLQKYWIYIAGAALVLLVATPADETAAPEK